MTVTHARPLPLPRPAGPGPRIHPVRPGAAPAGPAREVRA